MPLLEVQHIAKQFGVGPKALSVLSDIHTTLTAGEVLGIFGASGAGKSTLLHIFGGLDRPTAGHVLFAGKNLALLTPREQARLRNQSLGFVFQFYHLLAEFTALENVMIPCLIAGCARATARSRAADVLARVGLGDRLAHRPAELSGGEQQRVALARAIVMEPQLLLADEPTGNLDRASGEQVWELLLGIARERHTGMVIVSHNHELLSTLPRRSELRDGRLHELMT